MVEGVSLITTVKDAADHVGAFLASVAAQTRAPDEVVVVDGGSTDGTLEVLRRASDITLLEEPGANIARGRNLAIGAASHDVIAVSDADCILDDTWLARLLEPIDAGADVSMGAYVPIAEGFLQRCLAAVNMPAPTDLDEATFLPSARSVAFRRRAIEAAGGYPEWLDIGEDMYVNLRWRELGLDLRLAPDAIVRWRLRRGLAEIWRQYFRYARGDAIAGMHAPRHALRFATYGALVAALAAGRRWPRAIALACGAAYAVRPIARGVRGASTTRERAASIAGVPAMMAYLDVAKMAGYVAGVARRGSSRSER